MIGAIFDYRVAQSLGLFRGTFCYVLDDNLNFNSILSFFNNLLLEYNITDKDSNIVFLNGFHTINEMKVLSCHDVLNDKHNRYNNDLA